MSIQRKRSSLNERITLAHERKVWVEENKRILRMEREAEVAFVQKQKRYSAGVLVAKTAQIIFPTLSPQFSI